MGLLRNIGFLYYGTKNFGRSGFERAAATWDNSVMERRLDGQVVMVTGANQGLGFQTSQELARRGATVYMVCRNGQRGEDAVQKVRQATGNQNVHLQVCDVSDLRSVCGLVAQWRGAGRRLNLLVHNAGILIHQHTLSPSGHEACFATAVLGPFALTRGLGPALAAAAAAAGSGAEAGAGAPSAKVVFVSSGGMYTAPLEVRHIANEDLSGSKYDGMLAYARDKRRQVALAERFAELWSPAGVGVYSMHPGWATTEGVRTSIPGFYRTFQKQFREVDQGADTVVWLALQDPSALQPGAFYLDRSPQPKHLPLAGTRYGREAVDALWAALERMCGEAGEELPPPVPLTPLARPPLDDDADIGGGGGDGGGDGAKVAAGGSGGSGGEAAAAAADAADAVSAGPSVV